MGYNTVIEDRKQSEEISKLQFELETAQQADKSGQSAGKADYTDGVYTGSADGFGGVIEVEAEIKDGVIKELTIVSAKNEDKAYLDAARKVIDDILEKQTADVDTVSGATFSSAGIQILFFILLPSAFTTAFSGVKTIFTQLGRGEAIELSAFISVLIVLSVYTCVFGRFFCGYACAFGSLGDAIHALYQFICKKCKKRPVQIPIEWRARFSLVKYVVLLAIVLLCFWGMYGGAGKYSPWEVFSMLTAGNFKLSGHVIGICLLVLILIGMTVCERFFCRFLCPMGAVFSILPVIPLFAARRDRETCIPGCSACQRNCPSDIAIPDTDSWEVKGDCFMCQKCMDTCPKSNVKCGNLPWKGNAIWFTLLRAGILAALLVAVGV